MSTPHTLKTEPKIFQTPFLKLCFLVALMSSSRVGEKPGLFGAEFDQGPAWFFRVSGWGGEEMWISWSKTMLSLFLSHNEYLQTKLNIHHLFPCHEEN